jgi:hypothetical protein
MARKLSTAKGNQSQVSATPESKNALMEWLKQNPMRPQQGRVIAGLIEYFLRQPNYVQTAMLSYVDEGMEIPYADALDKLARELREKAVKRRLGHDKPSSNGGQA